MSVMNTSKKLLLIDLECTCNDEPSIPLEQSEIIEIGMVVGDLFPECFAVLDTLQLYVRPVLHPVLTPFCKELTGIEQHTVDRAPLLEDALSRLDDFLAVHAPAAWGSWGNFDRRRFELEPASKSLANPLADLPHFNIKQLFARACGHRLGLGRAIELAGLHFEGRHHSGIDDSRNIGRIIDAEPQLRAAILKRL